MAASGRQQSRTDPAAQQRRAQNQRRGTSEGLSSLTEQLANRIIRPLGLVLLSRERIQETLDAAAEEGRITRRDSEELFSTLVRLGREQTDALLSDLERVLGRGRQQFDSATRKARGSESVDRLVRGADRARRSMGMGPSFPILGYDELTSPQVQRRLTKLSAQDRRKVRDYERAHANRKAILNAIDKALR